MRSSMKYCSSVELFCKLQLLLVMLTICDLPYFVSARSDGVVPQDKTTPSRRSYDVLVDADTPLANVDDPFSVVNSLFDLARFSRAINTDDGSLVDGRLQNNSLRDNCTDPNDKGSYESSCQLVLVECSKKSELIDYLAFVVCDLPYMEPVAYVVMTIWLIYLIALLATTVDNHFVPPLNFLAEKMKLSPSIAGITLLALGNGAPDIFVAYSGIAQDDAALVLGSLSGGGLFVTTVVLGTVVMAANLTLYKIDKLDFMRDLIAYLLVVVIIVAVAYDGIVYLLEACLFPVLYFVYLAFVITVSYIRACIKKRNQPEKKDLLDEIMYYDEESASKSLSLSNSVAMKTISTVKEVCTEDESLIELPREPEEPRTCYLAGLSWPKKSNFIVKIIWFIQLPFSLLRWITIPPFSHDGRWCVLHYILASFSPLPLSMLVLIAVKGWNGFTIHVNVIPLPVILILVATVLSLFLFCVLRPKRPPHWCVQILLVPITFAAAIVWLSIIANEVVSILRAFGLLLHIDTGILGLTVLAIGNSVADWVANTVVARSDKPQMAFASCFGAPLMGHVVGLSFAIIVKIVFYQSGEPFEFDIANSSYSTVKLSWVFLGVSLIMTALVFLIFKFSPKKIYGVVLLLLYLLFAVFAVLEETNILPVLF